MGKKVNKKPDKIENFVTQPKIKPIKKKFQKLNSLDDFKNAEKAILYRQFSRQKYSKYRHQFPRMRQSQVVSKVIKQWQGFFLQEKMDIYNQYVVERHFQKTQEQQSQSEAEEQKKEKQVKSSNGIKIFRQFDGKQIVQKSEWLRKMVISMMNKHPSQIQGSHQRENMLVLYFESAFQTQFSVKWSSMADQKFEKLKRSIIDSLSNETFSCEKVQPAKSRTQIFYPSVKQTYEKQFGVVQDQDSDFARDQPGCQKKNIGKEIDGEPDTQIGIRASYYFTKRNIDRYQFPRFEELINKVNRHDRIVLQKHGLFQSFNASTLYRDISAWQEYFMLPSRYFIINYQQSRNDKVIQVRKLICCKCDAAVRDQRVETHFKSCFTQMFYTFQLLMCLRNKSPVYVHLKTQSQQVQWGKSQIIFAGSVRKTHQRRMKILRDQAIVDAQMQDDKYYSIIRLSRRGIIHYVDFFSYKTIQQQKEHGQKQRQLQKEKLEAAQKEKLKLQAAKNKICKQSGKSVQYIFLHKDRKTMSRPYNEKKNLWMLSQDYDVYVIARIQQFMAFNREKVSQERITIIKSALRWIRSGKEPDFNYRQMFGAAEWKPIYSHQVKKVLSIDHQLTDAHNELTKKLGEIEEKLCNGYNTSKWSNFFVKKFGKMERVSSQQEFKAKKSQTGYLTQESESESESGRQNEEYESQKVS